MSAWFAAALAGTAVLLALAPGAVVPRPEGPVRAAAGVGPGARAQPWRTPAAVGAGLGTWAVLGGPDGSLGAVVAGALAGTAAGWALGRLEPPSAVRRRELLVEQLPTAVDLLASCLDAGAAPASALRTVGRALGGPVRQELDRACHRLELGGDPASAWADLAAHPQLGSLGRSLGRAHDSGASVADAVHHLAEELREAAGSRAEARARRLQVKVAGPLGLCLLPAFVVLGIVPLVVGLFGSLSLG